MTDAAILAAAVRVISRVGPARLTLADVGEAVGLSAATIVQRFGSKRGLLLAVAQQGVPDVTRAFAAAREHQDSPLHALHAVLAEMTQEVATPEALANSVAFLALDLSDPEFHGLALEQARAVHEQIRALLDDAVAADELAPCDTARVARAVQTTFNGALITWAIYRQGSLAEWLRADLDHLLHPYLPPDETAGSA
ncbi:MAG: TetR/AcrR family transcriptional regulator [Thermomicrobiales bacterium]